MKKYINVISKIICLFGALMVMNLMACNQNVNNDKSVLNIQLSNSFRQIFPDFSLDELSDIKLYKDSAEEDNLLGSWDNIDSLSKAEIEVEEGELSLILSASINGTSFTSSKKLDITKGSNVVLFALSVNTYGEGKGNLDIQITYPNVSSDTVQVSLVNKDGKAVDAKLTTEKDTASADSENQILNINGTDLPTGEYYIELSILTSDAKKKVSYSDSVLIANGVTSKGSYSCSTFVENGRLFELKKSADGKTFEASYALTDFIPIVDNVVKGDVFTFDFAGTSIIKSDDSVVLGIKSGDTLLNSTESKAMALGEKFSSFNESVSYEVIENAKSNYAADYKVYFKTTAASADSITFVASITATHDKTSRVSPVDVTFDCDNGTLASEKKYYAGKNLDITATLEGFAFLGWYDATDKKVTEVPSSATTLKAKWYDLNVVTPGTEEVYTAVTLTDPESYSYWKADGLDSSLVKTSDSNGVITLESKVAQNFSVTLSDNISVTKGEKYLISIDVYKDSAETAFFPRLIARKALDPEVVTDWNGGAVYPTKVNEFETLTNLYEVPEDVNYILFNISANGIGTFKFKNVSLKKVETTTSSTQADVVSIENDVLKVECDVKTTCVTVTDKRNDKVYKQLAENLHYSINAEAIKASVVDGLITLKCPDWQGNDFAVLSVGFNPTDSETLDYSVYKKASDSYNGYLYFPKKAVTSEGDYMVLPINEGMAIDYNDFTTLTSGTDGNWYEYNLLITQGHFYSMPFFGVTNKTSGAGFISIVKTPDDCFLSYSESDTNCVGPEWGSQKGKWGYTRNLSQTFFTEGGHLAIAKKYREYAIENGTLVTFDQKKQQRGGNAAGNIEKLVGAANIWRQNYKSSSNMEQELKDAGMDRLMLSHQVWEEEDNLQPVESLITRYDIYADVFPKEDAESCWTCPDVPWISNKGAYPSQIIVNSEGNLEEGWEYGNKEGGTSMTYSLCDIFQPAYAREKITEELKSYPYSGRFFDTTTTNLHECYSSSHGMTRSQSKKAKYDLLAVSSIENGLVTGSETGADFAVPVCDYFEGMMSLSKFRDPESGSTLDSVLDSAPDYILGVQLNEKLRLPLWELVYHDCCVAYWYWGDSNTLYSDDTIWDKRDDFNALYAVPPMYWVSSSENFQRDKTKIVNSYNKHAYITRNAFGSEMINHEYLTDDRSKQRTTFANGLQVTVDFNTNTISY